MIRQLSLILLALFFTLGFACEPTASEKETAQVAAAQSNFGIHQPPPVFDYSLERDVVIQLYRARNESIATHTVWRGDTSKLEGDCPSIGYPVPYDTSLTNPLMVTEWSSQGGAAIVEQAEPNGIFASKNSNATWVRCVVKVNGKTVTSPVYVEGKVTAYSYPLVVDYETGRVGPVANAVPTFTLSDKE